MEVARLSTVNRAQRKGAGKPQKPPVPPSERRAEAYEEIDALYDDPKYLPNARNAMKAGEKALALGRLDMATVYFLLAIASTLVGQGGKR